MGMGDGELVVLKLILRTFGAALLLCVSRLLRLVVGHAGLKDTPSAPARLLDAGVCTWPKRPASHAPRYNTRPGVAPTSPNLTSPRLPHRHTHSTRKPS